MKKLYTLLLLVVVSMSFGQTIYYENMGIPTGTTPIATYITGTAPATFQNGSPIVYSGTGDVRATVVSTTYAGASGGGNVFITGTAGRNFQIDGLNTSASTSANILLSFGYITANTATQLIVEFSTDATATTPTWTAIPYTNNANTSWNLVSVPGGILPSSTTLSLRFTQPAVAPAQMRIDDIKLTNFNPACSLVLGAATSVCDAVTYGIDTYTTTIPYTGGGVGPYTITTTSGTVGGDNLNSVAAGNIIITGVAEGTSFTVDVTKGLCAFSASIIAPNCKPINTLPYSEAFGYTAGTVLGTSQKWTNVNTGADSIVSVAGSLTYPGFTTSGNSVGFSSDGVDSFTPFTSTIGTVYYSYLLNISSMTGVTSVDGGYITGLSKGTGTLSATLWSKRIDDTSFNLGIEVRTANGATTTFAPATYATGTTYFIVVGYTIGTTTTASDDAVSLWVNPTLNAAQPAATITDAHLGTDLTDVDNFFLRQDSATETPALQIDELRIGTTWADVSTSFLGINENAISGLKIYPNPVTSGILFIETTANAEKNVVLYDILGKQVVNTTTSTNEVNVSNLQKGLYIVKITEEGNTATRKLIIQ